MHLVYTSAILLACLFVTKAYQDDCSCFPDAWSASISKDGQQVKEVKHDYDSGMSIVQTKTSRTVIDVWGGYKFDVDTEKSCRHPEEYLDYDEEPLYEKCQNENAFVLMEDVDEITYYMMDGDLEQMTTLNKQTCLPTSVTMIQNGMPEVFDYKAKPGVDKTEFVDQLLPLCD